MSGRIVLPGTEKAKSPLTASDKLTRLCFELFSGPAGRFSESMPALRDQILKSNMTMTPEALISLDIFYTILTAAIVSILTYIGVALLHVVYFALLPVAIPLMFILILNIPRFSASNRGAAIETDSRSYSDTSRSSQAAASRPSRR